jgi:UDP-GlcNAc:undecaprenyl-phosphate/decaprenyl-phosphate GlcNAc-1-phosphate transferase
MMLFLSISIFASACLSALITWSAREIAVTHGLTFGPKSFRHVHTSPIPRLGGVAIFSTIIVGFPLYLLAASRGLVDGPSNYDVLKVLAPAILLFAAGLVDDLRGIRPRTKLAVQAAGGLCLYLSGLKFACFASVLGTSWLNSIFCLTTTVFWVVLVCNAINLIDGLDGLAAGAALFSMVTIFTVALVQGRTGVAVATAMLAGSILGFLLFNFNPASIFLGDSGSLFVGFVLSGLVLSEAQRQQSVLDAISIPLISFALPLTDTALSVLRRFLSGHSLFGADREHIHHKLLELGLTQRQAVWILYGLSGTFAVLGLFLIYDSDIILFPVVAIVLLILFFGVRKLGYQEFAEFARLYRRLGKLKKSFASNITLRKTSAELQRTRSLNEIADLL